MRRIKPSPIRNKINFSNANELRVLKKRLGVSVDDLRRIVAKVGNSIVTVSKDRKGKWGKFAISITSIQIVVTGVS
jgi:hypothetical protein